jgi:type II secretory pathway pseudopilin PulG
LIELLVVIAIIAVLIAILVPAIQVVRAAALLTQCRNNMHQLVVACHTIDGDYKKFPPCEGWFPGSTPAQGAGFGTLHFHLLPYVEQKTLYDSSRVTGPTLNGENPGGPYYSVEANFGNANFVGSSMIEVYLCPADSYAPGGPFQSPFAGVNAGANYAPTNYAYNSQVFGLPAYFGQVFAPVTLATITDGTSNTIFFGERYQLCDGTNVPNDGAQRGCFWAWSEAAGQSGNSQYPMFTEYWAQTGQGPGLSVPQIAPLPGMCDYTTLQTPHSAGMVAGMGDGVVRVIGSSISLTTWRAIQTPRGNETLASDWAQ